MGVSDREYLGCGSVTCGDDWDGEGSLGGMTGIGPSHWRRLEMVGMTGGPREVSE